MIKHTRREALKQFAVVSAGLLLVPACMQDRTKSSFLLKNIKISPTDETMLAELCEFIIPTTDTPGAKDLSAHLFVLMMVDDCSSKEQQGSFMKGMEAFNELSNKTIGKSFSSASNAERKKLIEIIRSVTDQNAPIIPFFNEVKKRTMQAYTSSEFFMTKIQLYELIPGRYHGCVAA